MRYYSSTAGKMSLVTGISNTQTTLQVDTTTGLPTSYPYTILVEPGTVREEICTVTTAAGTTLTIARGQDGSSGQSHAAGVEIRHGFSARDLQEPQSHINASTNVHGTAVGSAVVGTTDNQTLTNKVINGGANTITNLAKSALPTDTVFANDTATLTQKTISGTANTISNIQKSGLPADTVYAAGNQTLTGKTIDGGSNTLTNIPSSALPGDLGYKSVSNTWTASQTFNGFTTSTGTFTGTLTGAGATFSGTVSAAGVTSSGPVSGTTGTFTGNVTAPNLTDSGWVVSNTGWVAASGWSIANTCMYRKFGPVVSIAFSLTRTGANTSAGNVANMSLITVPSALNPAWSNGALSVMATGPDMSGYVSTTGIVTLTNVDYAITTGSSISCTVTYMV